jgi:hypothetical protein
MEENEEIKPNAFQNHNKSQPRHSPCKSPAIVVPAIPAAVCVFQHVQNNAVSKKDQARARTTIRRRNLKVKREQEISVKLVI